jgi:hypothetical protein
LTRTGYPTLLLRNDLESVAALAAAHHRDAPDRSTATARLVEIGTPAIPRGCDSAAKLDRLDRDFPFTRGARVFSAGPL